jgi:hypothetical protein
MNANKATSGTPFVIVLESRYIKRAALYRFLREEFGPDGDWKVTVPPLATVGADLRDVDPD